MGRNQFGPELQNPAALRIRLDDLDALSGDLQLPVAGLRARIVLLQGCEAVMRGLQHLADQIFGQIEVVASYRQQRSDIGQAD